MTIEEQIKILDDKIKENQADYDLYIQNAKISALSSGKLDIYEYLTGEDLGYGPDPVQKAKFEYSPLGQVFDKGLDPSKKQERLLKKLKSIEDKTAIQLKKDKDSQLDIKSMNYVIEEFSQEAKNAYQKLVNQEKLINYQNLNFKESNNIDYDFSNFSPLREVFTRIHYGEILIPAVERKQENLDDMIKILKNHRPRTTENKKREMTL